MKGIATYFEKYSIAPSPSRDYYGIKVLQNEVVLFLWKISHGPHNTPIVRTVNFSEFEGEKTMQDDIKRIFGEHLLQHVNYIVLGENNRLLTLPKNLIKRLAGYLNLKDIVKLTTISRMAHEVFNDGIIWERLFRRYKRIPLCKDEKELGAAIGWRNLFKKKLINKPAKNKEVIQKGITEKQLIPYATAKSPTKQIRAMSAASTHSQRSHTSKTVTVSVSSRNINTKSSAANMNSTKSSVFSRKIPKLKEKTSKLNSLLKEPPGKEIDSQKASKTTKKSVNLKQGIAKDLSVPHNVQMKSPKPYIKLNRFSDHKINHTENWNDLRIEAKKKICKKYPVQITQTINGYQVCNAKKASTVIENSNAGFSKTEETQENEATYNLQTNVHDTDLKSSRSQLTTTKASIQKVVPSYSQNRYGKIESDVRTQICQETFLTLKLAENTIINKEPLIMNSEKALSSEKFTMRHDQFELDDLKAANIKGGFGISNYALHHDARWIGPTEKFLGLGTITKNLEIKCDEPAMISKVPTTLQTTKTSVETSKTKSHSQTSLLIGKSGSPNHQRENAHAVKSTSQLMKSMFELRKPATSGRKRDLFNNKRFMEPSKTNLTRNGIHKNDFASES